MSPGWEQGEGLETREGYLGGREEEVTDKFYKCLKVSILTFTLWDHWDADKEGRDNFHSVGC